MKALRVGTLLGFVFLFSIRLFSQSSAATMSGTVADASGAVIPSVTVTATNNATGVVTTGLSNSAGVYNFASLLPGVYKVTAELPGFRTFVYSDVQVGNNAQVRLNFTLQVAAAAQAVEVTETAENLITSSSSSVGEVLPQKQIEDLPLVSNNILDLVGVMAGVHMTNDAVFGAENTTFAGVSARDINVQRDGISVNNGRWPNGLDSPTRMNPDLVGEIRMILAPVDAEMGRGNGQLQIQTRSGTNQYRGAAVWNVQNSALDSNTWFNNSLSPRVTPNWRNQHEYNLAFGGPIKKNKTFFYTLWDQQIVASRAETFPTVLTDCARLGIFRYYDNVNNGNARQVTIGGATPTAATVNLDGSPKSPNGGPLRFLSVFGPLASNPTKNDCSDAQINTSTLVPNGVATTWDPNMTAFDTSGYVAKTLAAMPHANAFDNPGNLVASTGFFGNTYAPDGLNTATTRWVRTNRGADNLFGVGQANNRRQINVKIDHNFNERHKFNTSYSYEIDKSDDAALEAWPGILPGQDLRHPQVLSFNFTSVLSPALVNEARFGLSRTGANTGGTPDRVDVGAKTLAQLPQVNGESVITNIGFQAMPFGAGIFNGTLPYASHEVSPRWVYADTISLTRGKHSFRGGVEYRMANTKSTLGGSVQGAPNRPTVNAGNTTLAPVQGIARSGLAGAPGQFGNGNTQEAENLLTFLAGSLSGLQQARFINQLKSAWNDPVTEPFKIRDIHQNEFGSFFKDDWKATRDLTLNLGLRWDFYGVPWENSGLTTALKGGGNALFGLSGRSFANWMQPGVGSGGALTEIIYVGPHSPNPSQKIYNRDLNNFGPAIGFAWAVPKGGAGKTTVRGGYQIQYIGGGRGFVLDTAIGNPPGSSNTANYIIPANNPYFSLAKLVANPSLVPVQPTFLPSPTTSTLIPLTDRSGLINAFDPNFVSPYIQNVTLSVTRQMTSKLTLDVRYIGTLSRKMYSNMDLNSPNFLYNGLKEAFDSARKGGESPLLDQMFNGLNIAGAFATCQTNTGAPTPCAAVGTVNSAGVLQTGAMHLRASSATQGNLANGQYAAIATTLNTLTNAVSGNDPGSVLRYSGKFPENFIRTNPQFASAVLESNFGHANYHSLQAQITLRPVAGVSSQTTYTWSRNLGVGLTEGANGQGQIFTDPVNRGGDYTLLSTHREHVLINYGTFALPIGPNKRFFSGAHGILARAAENWQASWVVNLTSGAPGNITASQMLYGNGVPDIVGPFDIKNHHFGWNAGSPSGNLFTDASGKALYQKVKDPQCNNANYLAPWLANFCTLNAVADTNGNIVFQTPLPGKRGTFGQNRFEDLGTWTTDMAIQKRVQFGEQKSMTVRMDASNVFNHPTPGLGGGFFAATAGAPDLDMTTTTNAFGALTNKGGNRTFQLKARVDF